MLFGPCRHLSCLPLLLTQVRPCSSQGTAEQHQQDTSIVPLAPSASAQRLTKQQKDEVKTVLSSCFKQDSAGTACLLAKSLDDNAKKQLLLALEAALEPPELSRAAMAGGIAADAPDTPERLDRTAVVAPAAVKEAEVPQPTFQQLLRVSVVKGIPFVAFGFFDNMIMVRRLLHHQQPLLEQAAATSMEL
eukprot:GHRQ01019760.1.p1 GENE.GHRQ01019760.1~~GHRQ01019760.1.p1  ORF type:complete len:190 (+),score=40.51 GHRQ01019760.1:845-1414(+)